MQHRPPGKLTAAAAALYQRDKPPPPGNAFAVAIAAAQPKEIEVWPENWPAVILFCRLSTQWFVGVGVGGPTGLRYEAAYPLIDRAATSPEEWDALLDDLQTLERSALAAMSEKD